MARRRGHWTRRDWVDATDLCRLCDLMMMMMMMTIYSPKYDFIRVTKCIFRKILYILIYWALKGFALAEMTLEVHSTSSVILSLSIDIMVLYYYSIVTLVCSRDVATYWLSTAFFHHLCLDSLTFEIFLHAI